MVPQQRHAVLYVLGREEMPGVCVRVLRGLDLVFGGPRVVAAAFRFLVFGDLFVEPVSDFHRRSSKLAAFSISFVSTQENVKRTSASEIDGFCAAP